MGFGTAHCWGAVTWSHLCNISERKKLTTDGIMELVSFPSTQERYLWNCYTPLSEDPQCPRKKMAGQRIKPDLYQGLQKYRALRYFQGSSKNLAAGLRWLCLYLKGESHGGLRIARGDLTRRSSSCPIALPILNGSSICSSWRCLKPHLEVGQVEEVAKACVTPNGFVIMINREAWERIRAGTAERQCRKGLCDSTAEITKRGALDKYSQVKSHFSTLEVWTRAANWVELWGPGKAAGARTCHP